MKEWKTSRYFRKTVVQLRTEFRNDTESTIQVQTSNSPSNGSQNGLGSIPGKVDDQLNSWSKFQFRVILALAYGVFLDTCYAICFSEYVDGEGDDEDDIVSKLYGNAQRELMMER